MVRAMLTAEELQILSTSLGVAGRAVVFSLPVAILFAWALSRPRFPGQGVLNTIAHLPLVLPPVLVGYMLLLAFGVNGPLGGWLKATFGIQLALTAGGAALATAVMAFPLMVRAIRLSFEATDGGLFEAAAVLRASPWDRFWSLALPLAWPGVLAGAVTAFAAGLGRVRRGDHVCVQHRGRDADPAARHQCGAQHAGARRGGVPVGDDLAGCCDCGSACGRRAAALGAQEA
jgi:molybdate transport system permease protein